MIARDTPATAFKVGTFVCPKTKTPVPVMATSSLPFLEWPIVVEKCEACGEQHVLQPEDVYHPPAFGYE